MYIYSVFHGLCLQIEAFNQSINNTHCNLVNLIAQDSSVRVKLHKRYLKFLIVFVKATTTYRSVNFLCSMYDLCKYDLCLFFSN